MPEEIKNAINVEGLQRMAEEYDPMLRKLPYITLLDTLAELKVNVVETDGDDKVVTYHRKGGIARPYSVGGKNDVSQDEIGKAEERVLSPKECYTALKDHIMNYSTKRVISNKPEGVNNQTKQHPQEVLILDSKIKTVGEDILSALFFATRNTDDLSPLGMFDGFNEQINKEITSGDISTAKGNLFNTGAIESPSDDDDMEAFDRIVEFLRAANPFLRQNGILYMTQDAMFRAMEALGNKLKYKNALEWEVFLNHLRGLTAAPKLEIISHPILGNGSRLMYTVPDNLDFGLETKGDEQFVQVRAPYEDPNIAQFWMQWKAGTRVTSIHPKTFLVNDQTNSAWDGISGDYS